MAHDDTSFRAALRTETAADHERVDRLFGTLDLKNPEGYAAFLAASAAALVPVEETLEAAGAARLLPDWLDRRRRFLLLDDIAGMGAVAPEPVEAPALPAGNTALLGAIYVLEGSWFGGRVLLKQVGESQHAAVRANTRYLGHGGIALWRSFLERLDSAARDTSRMAEGVDAARMIFNAFERAAVRRLAVPLSVAG